MNEPGTANTAKDTTKGGRPKQARVLIVDDNPAARSGLKALLRTIPAGQEGIEVLEAANGKDALRLAAARQPHLMLIDIQMPLMDGVRTIRLVKRCWPGIKMAALTMFADRRREALEAGADVFLLKGAPPDRLLRAIQALLPPYEQKIEGGQDGPKS